MYSIQTIDEDFKMCADTLYSVYSPFGFPYRLTPAFSTPAILTASHFPLPHFQSPCLGTTEANVTTAFGLSMQSPRMQVVTGELVTHIVVGSASGVE